MKAFLLGTLALVGALVACSDSTSPVTLQVAKNTAGNSTLSATGADTAGASSTPRKSCSELGEVQPSDEWGRAIPWGPLDARDTLWLINAAPRFAGVDVYVDTVQNWHDEVFTTAYSGLFLQNNIVPQIVRVTATGNPTKVLATAQMTLGVNRSTTLVFTQHTSTTGGLIVLVDTVSAPPLGNASFRFVNAAPSASGAVDIYQTAGQTSPATLTGLTPVASNVPFEGVSPYVSYPAGPIHIIVTAAGDPSTVLYDVGPTSDKAGEARTLIFMDNPQCWPNGGPLQTFLVLKDRQ